MSDPSAAARADLAPSGRLRVGLNLANFLLISSNPPGGEPTGIAPDIGRELGRALGVPVVFVPYAQPGDLAAAAAQDKWDVGLIGADPLRATEIAFTDAYLEIPASYLVPAASKITSIDQVDRPGVRVAVADKSAYDMYLRRTIRHMTLERAVGLDASFQLFVNARLDALAGLGPKLLEDQAKLPGSRILDGQFMAVQQAIGTPIARSVGAAYLRGFVEQIKRDLVGKLIAKYQVRGVNVAP
ncbi:MAG: transporter substrate-binding domain-containing protein [Burkholderiales bacterium]